MWPPSFAPSKHSLGHPWARTHSPSASKDHVWRVSLHLPSPQDLGVWYGDRVSTEVTLGPGALPTRPLAYPPNAIHMIWALGGNTAWGRHATYDTSLALSHDCLENLPSTALALAASRAWGKEGCRRGYGLIRPFSYLGLSYLIFQSLDYLTLWRSLGDAYKPVFSWSSSRYHCHETRYHCHESYCHCCAHRSRVLR